MATDHGQQMNIPQDSQARLAGRARRGGNPIGPRRAFLASLPRHAPLFLALANFFSILLGQRRKRNQRYNALMSTDPNMTGNPNLKNCQNEMG